MSARGQAVAMALSMYLGEHCRFCNRVYKTTDDLRAANVVFAGYAEPDDGTRTACKACWEGRPKTPEEVMARAVKIARETLEEFLRNPPPAPCCHQCGAPAVWVDLHIGRDGVVDVTDPVCEEHNE